MKYCKNCGNELENESKFCKKCGMNQETEKIPNQQNTTGENGVIVYLKYLLICFLFSIFLFIFPWVTHLITSFVSDKNLTTSSLYFVVSVFSIYIPILEVIFGPFIMLIIHYVAKNNARKINIFLKILLIMIIFILNMALIFTSKAKGLSVSDYNIIEKNYESSALKYIREEKLFNLDYSTNNYLILKDIKSYYVDTDEERKEVALSCRGYVELTKSTGSAPNTKSYISCGEQFNADYETKGFNELYQYISSINNTEENTESEQSNVENVETTEITCDNYNDKTTLLDLISEYKFKKEIQMTDIEGPVTSEYSIDLKLYNNNIMSIEVFKGPQSSGEHTYGIYEINNNKITIKRLISVFNNNCSNDSIENIFDSFIINSDGSISTYKYNGINSDYTMPDSIINDSPIIFQKLK